MFRRFRVGFVLAFAGLIGCGGGGGGSAVSNGPTKWTVLVYMNAANDLFGDSSFNIEEMQQSAANQQVKIVVQWKQTQAIFPGSSFDGTRRYVVNPGSAFAIQSTLVQNLGGTVDMGDPQALADFVAWGKKAYPADRYALVLWDHGNGWRPSARSHKKPAFSYDKQTGHAIQIWQLPAALGVQKLDMIVWDCSLMQMAEVAYELRNNTRYVVGTEESPPAAGFPYDSALAHFQNSPDGSALQLADGWVDAMNDAPGYNSLPIEESVVDTTKLQALCGANGPVDNLATELMQNAAAIGAETVQIRANGKSYDKMSIPPRDYFDLVDIANRYHAGSPQAGIQAQTTNVINAAVAAVVYERHNSHSQGSHGLSIDFSSSSDFMADFGEYSLLDFGKANRWGQWLSIAP